MIEGSPCVCRPEAGGPEGELVDNEEVLGVAPAGTYDYGDELVEKRLRLKAIRVFQLKYMLLVRFAQGQCRCGRCDQSPEDDR